MIGVFMPTKSQKLYPDSGVELGKISSRFYDPLMNLFTFGYYHFFIRKAIRLMDIAEGEWILDMGSGSGLNACLMAKRVFSDNDNTNSGKKGRILGLDISDIMLKKFNKRCKKYPDVQAIYSRIDIPLDYRDEFDKVFISFVLHGFPFEVQKVIIANAYNALKEGGELCILDYNEFNPTDLKGFTRMFFFSLECKYAHEFVKRDWKSILREMGFTSFREYPLMHGFTRLLCARK